MKIFIVKKYIFWSPHERFLISYAKIQVWTFWKVKLLVLGISYSIINQFSKIQTIITLKNINPNFWLLPIDIAKDRSIVHWASIDH